MDNYRPICLTSVACRLFASTLKQRFLDAGLDSRIWPSQYGFRSKRCTEDAIFIARRHLELARAQRNGTVSFPALDWRKAFDSVHTERFLHALARFGITPKYVRIIRYIMMIWRFFVEDSASNLTNGHSDRGYRRDAY